MAETPEARLKRLRLRAWRRGTREMDLILGAFADAHLPGMSAEALDGFEAVLAENDHDLYAWIAGREAPPPPLAPLLAEIAGHVATRHGSTGGRGAAPG